MTHLAVVAAERAGWGQVISAVAMVTNGVRTGGPAMRTRTPGRPLPESVASDFGLVRRDAPFRRRGASPQVGATAWASHVGVAVY
ncbi:hypothetical protein [Pseudonocardia humida]|uniref:Uncharacterized protein n=1 Tax=Pseudonocardia humida TaxID=2800819 RepID=A0ABT1A0E8_9PSEU|nr:hypothetical protein [Pseudonocardia humida]MCO1656475.1 hypothetical protein [Pseudonocardia humida]